mmetsp:Transcript_17441/g.22072  ORF Transcript_17441/g.22072 Transcript_17441/m.22072 type:complete len:221 (+) Transcript_17441:560-1222(+)
MVQVRHTAVEGLGVGGLRDLASVAGLGHEFRGRLLILRDQDLANLSLIAIHSTTYGASLRLGEVLLQLALTVNFDVLTNDGASDNLVESAVVAIAALVLCLLGPAGLVAVAEADIRLLHQGRIGAMLVQIDFCWHILEALLWHMGLLEGILRRQIELHVSEQARVVLSPELLRLFEQESRLDLWVFFLGVLQTPPLFATALSLETGQLTTVDANSNSSKL